MKVIDFHVHIFPREIIERRERIARREKEFALIYGDGKARMTDGDDLLRYMSREGLSGAVVCAFPFSDSGLTSLLNDYILDVCDQREGLFPMAAISSRGGCTALGEAERCFGKGAIGLGEIAFYKKGLDRRALAGLEDIALLAEEQRKLIMLHVNEQVGHQYTGKSFVDFPAIVQFVGRHSELTLVLAHMGGGICFYELMPEIRDLFPRVFYDTAAAPFLYSADLYRYIECCIPEKVLFGSDYPLLSLSRHIRAMEPMGEEAKASLLAGNAIKVLHGS